MEFDGWVFLKSEVQVGLALVAGSHLSMGPGRRGMHVPQSELSGPGEMAIYYRWFIVRGDDQSTNEMTELNALTYAESKFSHICHRSRMKTHPLEFYPPCLSDTNVRALHNGIRRLAALLLVVLKYSS